jgi:hypothetical protein
MTAFEAQPQGQLLLQLTHLLLLLLLLQMMAS